VTFRSYLDGSSRFMGPETSMEVQAALGSDIALVFDECTPFHASRDYTARSTERTHRWLRRCLDWHAEHGPRTQLVFGIVQGGVVEELRRRSAEEIAALDLDGNALGGLGVGESRDEMLDAVEWAAPLLPGDRPRYFMGVGDPQGVLGVIERGIDLFDCVLPTRVARTGSAYTAEGRLNLRSARFARDPRPLEEGCPCPACTRFSRAYIRHLVNQQELLGLRLLSLHNLRFLLDLTTGARAAIERGGLAAYRADVLGRLGVGREAASSTS
jgi:queuine tRNA-ribosyltransferase